MLFGEYMLNSFFKGIEQMPLDMIREQSNYQLSNISKLIGQNELVVIAPIIRVEGESAFKSIVKIDKEGKVFYDQQLLMAYEHWDERSFFANTNKKLQKPMMFEIDGFNIAVMFGYEAHFDAFWVACQKAQIDIALIPTVSTFESKQRWEELLKMRSFTSSLYILRANRVGEFIDKEMSWKFYGDTFLSNLDGVIEERLGNEEGILSVTIKQSDIEHERSVWGFQEALKGRA